MSDGDETISGRAGQGGYEIEYGAAECFWGTEPASLVRSFGSHFPGLRVRRVLDIGCGEGKNAAFFAARGCDVDAYDVSERALEHGRRIWQGRIGARINFQAADALALSLSDGLYDVVIAYGLFHCLGGQDRVDALVCRLKAATRPGGVHVVCALNSRRDGFSEGHVAFRPVLCTHTTYLAPYDGWRLSDVTDTDLLEAHAPTFLPHTHAATRFYAQRPER